MPPKKKPSAPAPLIFDAQGAEVGRLGVDAVVAEDLDALLLADLLDLVGDALPVDLLVIQDVHLRDALVLHVGDLRRRLDVIGGDDTSERLRAGRLVLLRLALLGALRTRQADVGVRRRDHQDAGLVEQRSGDRRRPRVELAEVGDRVVVADGLAGVLRHLAGLPLAGRRGGVVKGHVLDLEVAGLAAGLLQRQLLTTDDVLGLRAGIALQRERRIDRERVATGLRTATAATTVVVAARGDAKGHSGGQAAPSCQRTYSQETLLIRDTRICAGILGCVPEHTQSRRTRGCGVAAVRRARLDPGDCPEAMAGSSAPLPPG